MTNIEHLVENGLNLIDKEEPNQWRAKMQKDVNFKESNISINALWEICQYKRYTYLPCKLLNKCDECEYYYE